MRNAVPTRRRKPTRTRYLVLTTCAVGVLGAGFAGVASARTTDHPQAARYAAPQLGSATKLAAIARPNRPHRPRPSATTPSGPATTPPATAPTTEPPATVAPTTAPTTESPATVAPTTAPTTESPATTEPTTAAPSSPTGDVVLDAVLAHINAARTANGLPAYAFSAALSKASQAHNALMAGGCGLSHQCPGEAGLGDRFTAAGVSWTSAGENIGQGNAQNTPDAITAAANGLTDLMLAEVAPNDGHRRNLLSSGFKHVGLAVTRGSDGRVWVTQDFVN
jgi:uncharacterized protein YkwD